MRRLRSLAGAYCLLVPLAPWAAAEDIEYAAEHLAEGAMDFRVATLPLWSPVAVDGWTFTAQGAWGRIRSNGISMTGVPLSLSAQRGLANDWMVTAFGFHDRMRFAGDAGSRGLTAEFARSVPLDLRASAALGQAGGTATDTGIGLAFGREFRSGWLRDWRLTLGAQAQRVRLVNYRFDYRVLDGASAGATGVVDYSGSRVFVTALLGVSRRFERQQWAFTPHALFGQPVVRRAFGGRITGPGFDIAGDTAANGRGRHFGDPILAVGLEVEYRPWRAAFDFGALLSQPIAEPISHKGNDRALLLSFSVRY